MTGYFHENARHREPRRTSVRMADDPPEAIPLEDARAFIVPNPLTPSPPERFGRFRQVASWVQIPKGCFRGVSHNAYLESRTPKLVNMRQSRKTDKQVGPDSVFTPSLQRR